MVNYDAHLTRLPPEPKVVRHCVYCDEEMREGDEVIQTFNDEIIHEYCLDDYVREFVVFIRGYLNADGDVE